MTIESIKTIKANTLAKLTEISASPKPTYSIDGQSFQWDAYFKRLTDLVDWCDTKLASEEPVEIISQGFSL